MKKTVVVLLVLILALGVLVACNPTSDSDVIRLNEVTHSVFYAPLYVAMNKGYFEEEGLKIELTNGGGSDKSMTAVLSNQADIGLMGPETAVYVRLGGSTNYPMVFGQLTKLDGSFLIGRKPEPNFKWSDLANKEIIGGRPGGMPAMNLEYALYKNGLVHGENVTINYDVQFDLITAAFEGGTGDYCTMFEPAASEYQAAGKGYIIAPVGTESGDMPYTCFMATKQYLEKNPEKVKSFMKAILKGIDFVMNAEISEVAKALKPSFPSTSEKTLGDAVSSYKAINAYKENPVMSEKEFQNMMDILTFAGTVETTLNYTDIIDNSIVNSLN